MKPTPTEVTIFATHVELDEPILVYRNVALAVPSIGDEVYYKYKKRSHSQIVQSVTWEYNVDRPYIRAKVQLK